MEDLKLAFLDIETTGLNPSLHSIWEIGIVIVTKDNCEALNVRCRPMLGSPMDPKALEIGKISEEKLMELQSPLKAKIELEHLFSAHVEKYDKADKMIPIGFNILAFDWPFFQRWWEIQCGNFLPMELGNRNVWGDKVLDPYLLSYFRWPPIDLMSVAALKYRNLRQVSLPRLRLSDVAAHVGCPLEKDKAHSAVYDADLCRRIWEEWEKEGELL
jgi:DNA polymerase III epsilon subunit-like protein